MQNKMKYIFLYFFIIQVSHCHNGTTSNAVDNTNLKGTDDQIEYVTDPPIITTVIRKCCEQSYFFNSTINDCSETDDDSVFLDHTNVLLNYNNYSLSIISKKIDSCPGLHPQPQIMMVPYDLSLDIVINGSIYDYNSQLLFDMSHYCLEMVGPTVDSSSLVLAYCLGPQRVITKCCPQGHYFDTRVTDCSPYYSEGDHGHDLSFLDFFDDGAKLTYKELSCNETFVKIGINEAYFNEDHLCISKSHLCYNSDEFCVDNMLKEGENELMTGAFVCPYNFINKCCPDGQSLYEHGCMETLNNSLSLIHILRTSRYKIKSISSLGTHCTPVTLEDNTKSDIKWSIDIKGFVIIRTQTQTITTRNFCIDDFTSEHEVSPVIKVCSEEVKEWHKVSSIKDWPENVLGKCCPRNMYYNTNLNSTKGAQCLEKTDDRLNYIEHEVLTGANISNLIYFNFPDCSIKEYYHKFDLFPSYYDYAKITEDSNLKIISKDNNCTKRETKVDRSKFCVDFVPYGDKYYKPVAIVCVASRKFHSERNAIVVSLVGISCAALISAFFSLIFMRVRRGMVTVKKINTLAGRILTSYVLSQLVGYLSLGIGALADFEEETVKCFVLAGFLIFFTVASFCWNTSICLEGLLLTMHVQMSEVRRYIWHSVWSWGVAAVITAIALIRDAKRDSLGCDAITPKIGVERCFFSDALAQLLYFYLPISITVVINAFLLVYAKILRKNKLKKLEKDPNRVRRHENLQQVLSIKSIRNKLKGEPSIKPASNPNHSGLRTHHNRNIWIESLKLVLWSGTTWLMEIIGTLFTMYRGRSQGEWYNYLWYLPVGFNCLRGLGIFVIISFNAENKTRILRTAKTLRISFSTTLSKIVPSLTQKKKSEGNDSFFDGKKKSMKRNTVQFSNKKTQDSKIEKQSKQRSTSVTTIITNISASSATLCTSEGDNSCENTLQVPSFFHSISQVDNSKVSFAASTLPDVFESFESDSDSNEDKKDPDQVSLDNTSMENFFWENELQARRNELNFLNAKNSLEGRKDDEKLPDLSTKEILSNDPTFEKMKKDETVPSLIPNAETFHQLSLEKEKDDEMLSNLMTKEETYQPSFLEGNKNDETLQNIITKEENFHHPSLEEGKNAETLPNLITKEAQFHHPYLEETEDDETSPDLNAEEAQEGTSHNNSSTKKFYEDFSYCTRL